MRIPFPERVPLNRVAIFAVVLFLLQQLERTSLYFSVGCTAFILISALAFNAAGGLTRAAGAYVFFYSTLVVIVGICYKAFLGEPAQSNLVDPKTDIEVYIAGISAMYAAVIVSRRFARRSALMQNLISGTKLYRSSVGCIVVGALGGFAIALLGSSAGPLISAFAQFNQLIPLGIVAGVMYEIRRSGGTRTLNLPVAIAIAYYFFVYGIIGFSKQGMLTPLVCWALPAFAARVRLSVLQIAACCVTVFVVFQYLVPYAQYGRKFMEPNQSIKQRVDIAIRLIEHPSQTRQDYEDEYADQAQYYNTQQGFWDRLQFVSVDDGLNNITDQGRVYGLLPIQLAALNVVPHIFWKDKPEVNFGIRYSHEITGIEDTEDNTNIGISFSPTAEAYHMDKWRGVLVVAPLIWFVLFFVLDSLLGDLRTTPWGLLALALISHIAPEGALTGAIYLVTVGVEILIFCAFFAAWVAPLFGDAVLGPQRSPSQPHLAAINPRIS